MNSALQKFNAALRASRRIQNQDRRADFSVADAGLDAIFNNLLTTQRGVSQSLTGTNADTLAAMERLAAKSTRGVSRGVTKAGNKARNLFGSAMGPVIERELAPARATAQSTGTQARAAVGAGKLAAQGATTALGIQSAAASEAASSADYALAQALGYRAKDDAALIAAQQLELAKMRMDARQNERYLRLQNQLSGGSEGGANFQDAAGLLQSQAADPTFTSAQATALISSMTYTHNLGPQAVARLREMVGVLYPDGATTSTLAPPPTDEQGNPLQVTLDAEDQEGIKQAFKRNVGLALPIGNTGTAKSFQDMSDAEIAQAILNVVYDDKGVPRVATTNELLAPQYVADAVAYFRSLMAAYSDPAKRAELGLQQDRDA